jgi:hypothetical protein
MVNINRSDRNYSILRCVLYVHCPYDKFFIYQMTHMILRLSTGTFQQYLMDEEVAEPENLVASARHLASYSAVNSAKRLS